MAEPAMRAAKVVCPDCGLPGSHITSADCIRALKAALKQLQEAGRS